MAAFKRLKNKPPLLPMEAKLVESLPAMVGGRREPEKFARRRDGRYAMASGAVQEVGA